MSMLALNTLAYAKKLIAAGVPERQAEAQAEALAEIVEDTLATKRDIKELEGVTQREIKELEEITRREIKELEASTTGAILETRREIKELETCLRRDMKDLEYRMIIKLGTLMVVTVSAMAALQKVL